MRNLLRLFSLVAMLATVSAAHAADVSGTWKGIFNYDGTNMPLTLHLTVADGAVTGSMEGLPVTPEEIHDGKVNGDTITYWVNTTYQGQDYKLLFTGKIAASGDEIAFNFGTDDGSWSAQFTAARSTAAATAPAAATVPATDVSGTWKGAFDFNGSSVPLTFHLTSAAGAVTGTVEGLPTTPVEIHDGKVDGATVQFWLNTDYQGQPYKLLYTGKIAGGQIVFTFGTDDGSFSAQMTASKAGA